MEQIELREQVESCRHGEDGLQRSDEIGARLAQRANELATEFVSHFEASEFDKAIDEQPKDAVCAAYSATAFRTSVRTGGSLMALLQIPNLVNQPCATRASLLGGYRPGYDQFTGGDGTQRRGGLFARRRRPKFAAIGGQLQ